MPISNTEAHMRSQNKPSRNEKFPNATPVSKPADTLGNSPRSLVIGLKILEYLSTCRTPTTRHALAAALNASPSSVYRSMQVLEDRGYVAPTGENGLYQPTRKLHQIQSTALPHLRLLDHAQPVMRTLSDGISQSCNLSIPSTPDMQVVAQEESPGPFGINIPVGFRYDIPGSAPGLAFAAFTKNSDTARWPKGLSSVFDAHQWASLKNTVQKVTEAGFAQLNNPHLPDVIDLSCPIFDSSHLIAILTVPYIKTSGSPSLTWCLAALQQAAEQLNESLHSDALVA